jgi:hypothetical protein
VTTKVKIALAVAAAAGVGYYLWRRSTGGRPICGIGSTWKVTSDPTGYSTAVAASIRQWGGYCAKQGFVSVPDVQQSGPITDPFQLPY